MAQMGRDEKVAVYISMVEYGALKLRKREYEINDSFEFTTSLETLGVRFVQNEDGNKKYFRNVEDMKKIKCIVNKTKEQCVNASMLFVVISSHGRENAGFNEEYNHQIAFYDEWINTSEIIEEFSTCISPEKQKVFIIQACSSRADSSGKLKDKGISIMLTEDEPKQDLSAYQQTVQDAGSKSMGTVIPVCVKNSVVVFTSVSGFDSFGRNGEDGGGWFLKEFRNLLDEEKENREAFSFLDFLGRVNQKMSLRTAYERTITDITGCKAVATITHKLTSDIMLQRCQKSQN